MDKSIFWATKSPLAQYETVTFDHPDFAAPFRLVKDQFADVTLGGDVYTPAPMEMKRPEQRGDGVVRMPITFPRPVVGRQFKQQLRLIAGSRDPITVSYGLWLGDTDAPKVSWNLYASDQGGVNFSTEVVQVTATLDNPLRRDVSLIYDPSVFTGLETL